MNKTMKRLFGIVTLMMVSLMVSAQGTTEAPEQAAPVKIDISEAITGGTVTAAVGTPSEVDNSVMVTLTVTPADGYYITKGDLVVVATMPLPQQAEPAETRADGEGKDVVIEGTLELAGDDPDDLSASREYSFTLQQGLGAWVQKADFHSTALVLGSGVSQIEDGSLAGVTSITIENSQEVIPLGGNDVSGKTVKVPANIYNAYKAADGWKEADIVTDEDAVAMKGVKFVEDKNQYDVFVADQDLMVPVGVLAYTVTGIQGNRILLDEVKVISKDKPVLLYSENIKTDDLRTAVAQEIRTRADEEEPTTGCELKVAPAGGRTVTLGEVYLLYNDKFYLSQAGTIPAGNIYLEITKDDEEAPVKRTRSFLTIGGSDDETTAIRNLTPALSQGEGTWHDLSGRRLSAKPTAKGVYINNGRKVVVR